MLLAQRITNPTIPNLSPESGQAGVSRINQLIQTLITLALIVAAVVFFFMLVIGGIEWISSGGDKEKLSAARTRITNAIVGLLILFSLWAFLVLIEIIFKVNVINLDIQSLRIQ